MVALSFKSPYCQKTISSGLSRMAGLLGSRLVAFDQRTGYPKDHVTREEESEQARYHPLPVAARDEVKSTQCDPQPYQQTA